MIHWWVLVAQLVEKFHIPMKDAWNMTLREYTMMGKHSKVRAITATYDKSDLDDILSAFEVKAL